MNKLALVIGIDDYAHAPLQGCVGDATRVAKALSQNSDQTPNFSCLLLTSPASAITKPSLKEAVSHLFSRTCEIALLFFAGHGTSNNLGGYPRIAAFVQHLL